MQQKKENSFSETIYEIMKSFRCYGLENATMEKCHSVILFEKLSLKVPNEVKILEA
jgi:hypothetical protein